MKTLLYVALALIFILKQHVCFLSYPFGDQVLGELFDTFDVQSNHHKSDLLNHSVKGESCSRVCRENDRKICHFTLTVKNYQIMGG